MHNIINEKTTDIFNNYCNLAQILNISVSDYLLIRKQAIKELGEPELSGNTMSKSIKTEPKLDKPQDQPLKEVVYTKESETVSEKEDSLSDFLKSFQG